MTDHTPEDSVPDAIDAPPPEAENRLLPVDARGSAPSHNRGLPRWAWALIVAGSLLCLGVVGNVITLVTLSVGAPDTPDNAGIRIPLDGVAIFPGQPTWTVPVKPSWEILTSDENGVNMFLLRDVGCLFMTSQNLAPIQDSASDRELTDVLLAQQIDAFSDGDPDAFLLDSGSVDLAVGDPESGSVIEFSAATLQRSYESSENETVEMISRAMPGSGSTMWAVLSCEPDVYTAGKSPFDDIISELAVTVRP